MCVICVARAYAQALATQNVAYPPVPFPPR